MHARPRTSRAPRAALLLAALAWRCSSPLPFPTRPFLGLDGSAGTRPPLRVRPVPSEDPSNLDPTRPLAPLSTHAVSSQRPTLRWRVGATDRAPTALRVCPAPAPSPACLTFVVAGGDSLRPTAALAPGVWFWQLLGTARGEGAPVWQFTVGPRDAADTSWPSGLEVTGDRFPDLAVLAGGGVQVYQGLHSAQSSVVLGSTEALGPVVGANALGVAGDLDGDGVGDLAVGVQDTGDSLVLLYPGDRAGLYSGESASLPLSVASPGFSLAVRLSLTGLGDADGDGYGDLASGYAGLGSSFVRLTYGARGLLSPLRARRLESPLHGSPAWDFGYALASAGDLDGDGLAELLVGEPELDRSAGRGAAHLFWGHAEGAAGPPASTLLGPLDAGHFGAVLALLGDTDGDGHPELAVGAPGGWNGDWRVYLYRATGNTLDPAPFAVLRGASEHEAGEGLRLAGPCDLDGDGLGDVVLGLVPRDGPGEVRAWLSASGGPAATPVALRAEPGSIHFGESFYCPGDVDGDGYGELAVAQGEDDTHGVVLLYPGSPAGPVPTPSLRLALAAEPLGLP